ncbi:hypothetical protein MHY86_08765 [Aerococcus urinaeequi]|uniref:hypothetical protein n=1 Tax=Aerococcus urinaeequi TaxID=51665 RepID=UPI00227F1F55|nr:hypothetical protein [Aerococcus urinaeequi]MCY7731790.1 hypothetical protein [Aerococcus urinaeequi]
MEKNSSSVISLSSILTVVFVVLKLIGVINWSWWLVFLPTLIHIGLTLVGLLIVALIALAVYKYDDSNK